MIEFFDRIDTLPDSEFTAYAVLGCFIIYVASKVLEVKWKL